MTMFKKASLAIAAVSAGLIAAAPANAVITTFASFNTNAVGNIVWRNNGTVPVAPVNPNTTYTFNGTGGTIFTTNSAANVAPRNAVAGGVGVTFSYLNALNAFVANAPATFTLNAVATASPAQTAFGFKFQQGFSATGSFSFISTGTITINNVQYGPGANLLSGSFSNVTLSGQSGGSTASFGGSVASEDTPAVVSFTSDFLAFPNSLDRDLSFSIGSIVSLNNNVNVGLNNASGRALRSFRATATGTFAADPTPTIIPTIPEPGTWAMFVVGFGMVGIGYRRRKAALVSA